MLKLFIHFWRALDRWNVSSRGSSRALVYSVLVCLVAVRGAERPSVCRLVRQPPHFVWIRVSSSYTCNTKPQLTVLMVEVLAVQEEAQFTSCMIRSELPNNCCWKQDIFVGSYCEECCWQCCTAFFAADVYSKKFKKFFFISLNTGIKSDATEIQYVDILSIIDINL